MARNSDLPLPENAVAATYLAGVLTIFAVAPRSGCSRGSIRDATAGALHAGRGVRRHAGATRIGALFTPVLVIVCVLALPYVFYLYYLGVQQLLRVPSHEAAQFVAIALVAALVASTLGGAGIGALGLL